MKKVLLLISINVLFFVSCIEDVEKSATAVLDEARVAYECSDFDRAKLLLDSIKTTYPKAFKVRREALQLSRDVELGEQLRSLEYYDSRMEQLVAHRDSLLVDFVLEKESRYQDVGNYMLPSQIIKNNVGNSYLRTQVDEKGKVMLISIYRGKSIQHKSIRVNSGDSYAECDTPTGNYTSRHLGVTTERVSFSYGKDGGIMDFIATGSSPFTVQLSGKGKFSYTLRSSDAQAVVAVLELAAVLQELESIREMRDEAERHIEFIKRSKEKYDNKEDGNNQP